METAGRYDETREPEDETRMAETQDTERQKAAFKAIQESEEGMSEIITPYEPVCMSPIGCRYSYNECGAKRYCKIAKDELDWQLHLSRMRIERTDENIRAAIFVIVLLLVMAVCFLGLGVFII